MTLKLVLCPLKRFTSADHRQCVMRWEFLDSAYKFLITSMITWGLCVNYTQIMYVLGLYSRHDISLEVCTCDFQQNSVEIVPDFTVVLGSPSRWVEQKNCQGLMHDVLMRIDVMSRIAVLLQSHHSVKPCGRVSPVGRVEMTSKCCETSHVVCGPSLGHPGSDLEAWKRLCPE